MRQRKFGIPATSSSDSKRISASSSIPAKCVGSGCSIRFESGLTLQPHVKKRAKSMRYSDAGVDISVAEEAKRRIAAMAGRTFRKGVLAPIGGFGALYQLDRKRWREPVLVASADGVGTKLKIAFATGIHSSVGADILNHCVNDILTQGAEPLFFLDYLAMGKIDARIVEQVIEGMSRAAKQAGCSLIGGETAEMAGFYAPGEYDLAGFIVGAVEKSKQLDPRRVRPGDALIGLPSTGLHTNGYSLARKLVFETAKIEPDTYVADVGNK